MKLLHKYQFNILSIVIIALTVCFLFQKPLTGEYTFSGPDSLSPRAVNQGITLAQDEYGKYPLWLPWIFSGLPSVHSFQNISDYYFPNFIINILEAIGIPSFWNYIFHFILAGMGVFAILQGLTINRYSALFGGLSFALMPYLITMVVHGHGSQMMTTAWLPWVIWAVLRLYEKTTLRNLGILGIIVGLQLQRAHVQIAYYSWMTAGLLMIMLLLKIYDKPNKNPRWIIYASFAFILGLCMAMWIYLPALSYTPYSIRGAEIGGGTGFTYATAWSFSFGEMATFFIPSFYGFGGATYWGNMPFTDYPNYMGIFVVTLAIIGLLFYDGKIKWFFIITALLALLFSFGKHFFLYEFFYEYFPYFNKFRVPAMFLILTQFSISVLAGLGFDISINWIQKNKNIESLKKLIGVVISVIAVLCLLKLLFIHQPGDFPKYPQTNLPSEIKFNFDNLRLDMINQDMIKSLIFLLLGFTTFYITRRGWMRWQALAGIIISLSVIDLVLVNNQIIEPDKNSYRQSTMTKNSFQLSYLQTDEVIRFLKQDKSQYRILPLQPLQNENRWSAFHIESIEGYHPAKIFRYNKVKDEVGWNSLGVLQMLNVKYIISQKDLSHPAFEQVFYGKLLHQGEYVNTHVYQFKYFMPRYYFVHQLENISDIDYQLQTLKQSDFNPLSLSFVEHDPQKFIYDTDAKVEIIHWSPDKIEFQLDVPTKQFMVISEIFYPEGWKITSHLDWEIHPVNSILRGIYVPKGQSQVVMEFIPKDIIYGTILTFTSTLLILIFILSSTFINRKINAD